MRHVTIRDFKNKKISFSEQQHVSVLATIRYSLKHLEGFHMHRIHVFINSNKPDEKFWKDCCYFIIISDDGHRFLLLLPLCIVSCGVISFAIVGSKYLIRIQHDHTSGAQDRMIFITNLTCTSSFLVCSDLCIFRSKFILKYLKMIC